MIFGEEYAAVYDAFYAAKDYEAEGSFLLNVIAGRAVGPVTSVLDLGCGTGAHDIVLAQKGLHVFGVDISSRMLARAEARRTEAGALRGSLEVTLGDIRTLSLGRTFDLVVSLFHVMSYQTNDSDVAALLATAHRHLQPGGLFVFDFWHGPAVLAQPPRSSERTAETASGRARRVGRSEWLQEHDLVRVSYEIELTRPDGVQQGLSEEHLMRYFFLERLAPMLEAAGLEIVETGEWGTAAALSADVFGAYVAARAVA